jgi:predicted CoA-binding protein
MTPREVLAASRTVLLIDWPSRGVPESLARAGYEVVSHDGPSPLDHNAYDLVGGEVITRNVGAHPEHADLVYNHRPIDELPGIIDLAKRVGAAAIWCETGSADAREMVEAGGLVYADEPIVEAARATPRPAG